MSGFMIVICIMLVMFVMLAIVLVRDTEREHASATPADDVNEVASASPLYVVDHDDVADEGQIHQVESAVVLPDHSEMLEDDEFDSGALVEINPVADGLVDASAVEEHSMILSDEEPRVVDSKGDTPTVVAGIHEAEESVPEPQDRRPEQAEDV